MAETAPISTKLLSSSLLDVLFKVVIASLSISRWISLCSISIPCSIIDSGPRKGRSGRSDLDPEVAAGTKITLFSDVEGRFPGPCNARSRAQLDMGDLGLARLRPRTMRGGPTTCGNDVKPVLH